MQSTPDLMSYARYRDLMHTGGPLTNEEIAQGWHFCMWGWDGLLIHPTDEEFEHCCCFEPEDKEALRVAASRPRD